jgi:Zn-dependent protease with chaperone function
MSHTWSARYLDGVTAYAETVSVTPAAHGLEIRRPDGGVLVWRYADTVQTQGDHHGEQVRLERRQGTGEVLAIDDAAAFLSRLHAVAPRVTSAFHDPRTRAHRPYWIVTAAVVGVLLSIGIYIWGIPAAAELAAAGVPVSWEEELGESVSKAIVGSESVCTNSEVKSAITDIVERIAATEPSNPYTFRVTVVRHDVMNAFAAPGGHIVVFSGLLDKTERPEELAGVLAHEMSHVLNRHGTKSMFRELSTSIFLSVVLGDMSGAAGTVLESAKTVGGLHYSRQAEEEADRHGAAMLQKAQIDPSGMVSFFEKLEKQFGQEPEFMKYMSSHPPTRDRIAKLKAENGKAAHGAARRLSGRNWKHIANSCDLK